MQLARTPPGFIRQCRDIEGPGEILFQSRQHPRQRFGQGRIAAGDHMAVGVDEEGAVEMEEHRVARDALVGVEGDRRAGEGADLDQVVPACHPFGRAHAVDHHLHAQGEAAVGIEEIAAPDGAFTLDVPEQVAGADLDPLVVDLDPSTSAGHQFDAFHADALGIGAGVDAGALMVMGNGMEGAKALQGGHPRLLRHAFWPAGGPQEMQIGFSSVTLHRTFIVSNMRPRHPPQRKEQNPMSASKLRFGIVGTGMISFYMAKGIKDHANATITAAHDIHAGRLAEFAKEFGVAVTCATAAELYARADVDAVYIAVPNKFHAALAIQALKAGKHVILDKPFALSLAEAEEVVAEAKKSGKVFTLGMNRRFITPVQKGRSLIKKGALGTVYHAKACWLRRAGIPRLQTWFSNKELAGGGSMLDIGVHMLDSLLYMLDDFNVAAVSGAVYTKFGNRGLGEGGWGKSDRDPKLAFTVDDFASAFIKLKSGTTICLDSSWALFTEEGNKLAYQVFGDEGGITIPDEGNLKVHRRDALTGGYFTVVNPDAEIAFPTADRFDNFIKAVHGEEKLAATPEQSLAVQRILDAIYASSATGREVQF